VQVCSEGSGVLERVYRLVGRGLNDREIANTLSVTEQSVHECVSWMLKSLHMSDRLDLVRHASKTPHLPNALRHGH
jgi:DNA-binding NarL/FixJ family response regulator